MRAESWDDDEDSDNAPLLPVHAASEADSSATATSSWEYTYLNIQGKIYRSRWPIFCIFVVWSFCLLAALNDAVDDLTWQSWFVIALVWGGLVCMINDSPPDVVLLGINLILRVFNIITEDQAWSGFRSEGLLAIGVLFVVAKCLEEAGTIELAVSVFLGKYRNSFLSTLQLCVPVVLCSSFINNTPVVAMMLPIVTKWAAANGRETSRFLMPLSFAALLGGTCTLIGTSANLILQDLLVQDKAQGHDPGFELSFFSTTPVALPSALIGVLYMAISAPYLLPVSTSSSGTGVATGTGASTTNRKASTGSACDYTDRSTLRLYPIDFVANQQAQGKTAQDLAIERVPGAVLRRVACVANRRPKPDSRERAEKSELATFGIEEAQGRSESEEPDMEAGLSQAGDHVTAPSVYDGTARSVRLEAGDILRLECTADAISKLRKVKGISAVPKSKLHAELGPGRRLRCLVEVVLGARCPLIGLPIHLADSLTLYNSAILALRPRQPQMYAPVVAVHNRILRKVGFGIDARNNIVSEKAEDSLLKPGDTLLLETYPNFVKSYSDSDHFALVREIEDSAPPRLNLPKDRLRRLVAGAIFLSMVVVVASGRLTLLVAMSIASFLLLGIQCITVDAAFRAIKGRVVLAAVAAFGLGNGLTNTNVTMKIAQAVVQVGLRTGPVTLLFLIYFATACLSCLISVQATVVIVYGIIKHLDIPHVSMGQLVVILAIGASSSFMTPVGYQTNLMVWRAGGYSFLNYFYFGFPLTLIVGTTSALLCRQLVP